MQENIYQFKITGRDSSQSVISGRSTTCEPLEIIKNYLPVIENTIKVEERFNGTYLIKAIKPNGNLLEAVLSIKHEGRELKANTYIQNAILKRLEDYGYNNATPASYSYYTAVRQVIKLRLGKSISQGNFYESELGGALEVLNEILPRKGSR